MLYALTIFIETKRAGDITTVRIFAKNFVYLKEKNKLSLLDTVHLKGNVNKL